MAEELVIRHAIQFRRDHNRHILRASIYLFPSSPIYKLRKVSELDQRDQRERTSQTNSDRITFIPIARNLRIPLHTAASPHLRLYYTFGTCNCFSAIVLGSSERAQTNERELYPASLLQYLASE